MTNQLPFSVMRMMKVSIILCLLVLGLYGASSVHAAEQSQLLSYNKTAYTSSVEGNLRGDFVTDNDAGTRWSSAWGIDSQWVYIDLGASATIDRIQLLWENSYATSYQIDVSDDEYNWTTIYSTAAGAGGLEEFNVAGQGRYVRMLGLERSMSAYGYSLFEFKVYGTGGLVEPIVELGPNLALNQPAFASSVEEAWYIEPGSINPGKAVDGDMNTRWGSNHTDQEWFYVDLGSVKEIGTIRMEWEGAAARAYDLQVSNDGMQWTTIYRELRGNGDRDEVQVYAHARYVKVQGIARMTSWGYSLREFEVYGYQPGAVQPNHPIAPIPSSQTVVLGGGSYLTNEITMPQPKLPDYRSNNVGKPIASNDWWQSLLINRLGDAIVTLPLKLQLFNQGLGVLNPGEGWINNDGSAVTASGSSDLFIMGNHINSASMRTKVTDYGDFSVQTVLSDDETDKLVFNITKGSPYVFAQVSDLNAAEIYSANIQALFDSNGNPVLTQNGSSVTTDHIGIEIVNQEEQGNAGDITRYYGLFLPEGTVVTRAGNKLKLSLGQSSPYFSVAALPSAADLQQYYLHGYAHVTDTTVTYQFHEATSKIETQFQAHTQLRRPGFSNETLLALYPHQWKMATTSLTNLSYPSIRGQLKVSAGNTFTTEDRFHGIVPQFTEPTNPEYSRASLLEYLQWLDEDTSNNLMAADAYWQGKKLHPLAMGVFIAEEIGETQYKELFLQRMKTILTDWYTYTEGEPYHFFYYEDEWGTLYYKISEFGANTGITDHHFTYGYYVFASAVLAMYDQQFYTDYKDMIDLLVRDYANPSRTDAMFPQFRSFDPYEGHSWAGGYADNNNGNNQEAAGESLFGWVGQYVWAQLTENKAFRDAAIYGFTTELKAIEQYWFNYDGDNWHDQWQHASVGQVYGSSYFFGTFFSGEPVHIYGIHWLPTAEWMISFGFDPAKSNQVYQGFVADNGGSETEWQHIVWPFQALGEPAAVIAKWNTTGMQKNEAFNAYWFVHSMASLGQRTKDIWAADGNSATVYKKGNVYRALAWNPTNAPITITFKNDSGITGTTTVPARSLIKIDPTVMDAPRLDAPNHPDPGTPGETEGVNVALNKSVSVSSVELPFNGVNAVDGDKGTRWASEYSDAPQWLQIDLGTVHSFNEVVLHWEAAYAKSYLIQTSADGSNWATIYETTTGSGNVEKLAVQGAGRYVRVYCTERVLPYGYSLWEVEVINHTSNEQPITLLSEQKAVNASSIELPFYEANVVDGRLDTRWSSAHGTNTEWLVIDLGQTAQIREVVLDWEAAYASKYTIQTSSDGAQWNDIYSTSNSSGGHEQINVLGQGRYVRLLCEERATIYGYSLYELQISGFFNG